MNPPLSLPPRSKSSARVAGLAGALAALLSTPLVQAASPAAESAPAVSLQLAPLQRAAPSVPDAAMAQAMNTWVDGERDGSVAFFGAGLLSMGGGLVLLSREGGVEHGAGATFLATGGALTLFGAAYGIRLPKLRSDLSKQLERDPSGYDAQETARMMGIVDRFYLYRWAEIAVGATGMGLLVGGLAGDEDVVAGVGIGMVTEAAVLLVLDSFVEARGHRYLEQLESWKPTAAVGPAGAMVGVGRAF